MKKFKIKIGDKVIIPKSCVLHHLSIVPYLKNDKYINNLYRGVVYRGVVVDVNVNDDWVGIEFDDLDIFKYAGLSIGHSCHGNGKDGHCWSFTLSNVYMFMEFMEDDYSIIKFKKELDRITL